MSEHATALAQPAAAGNLPGSAGVLAQSSSSAMSSFQSGFERKARISSAPRAVPYRGTSPSRALHSR